METIILIFNIIFYVALLIVLIVLNRHSEKERKYKTWVASEFEATNKTMQSHVKLFNKINDAVGNYHEKDLTKIDWLDNLK